MEYNIEECLQMVERIKNLSNVCLDQVSRLLHGNFKNQSQICVNYKPKLLTCFSLLLGVD